MDTWYWGLSLMHGVAQESLVIIRGRSRQLSYRGRRLIGHVLRHDHMVRSGGCLIVLWAFIRAGELDIAVREAQSHFQARVMQ